MLVGQLRSPGQQDSTRDQHDILMALPHEAAQTDAEVLSKPLEQLLSDFCPGGLGRKLPLTSSHPTSR
eukprot:6024663-Karenia_brevis.AAC.1